MDLSPNFSFRPLPDLVEQVHFPFVRIRNPLGPLALLGGTWHGSGFNTIWRPFQGGPPSQDRFLELNLTTEKIEFSAISGPIPNRGLLQQDMNMFGLTYLQQISDSSNGAGLHIEPGIWAVVPPTTNPHEPATVVRMASIPHGTTVLLQGVATTSAGPPTIPPVSIVPFNAGGQIDFPERTLGGHSDFRIPADPIAAITQAMLDDPNTVLRTALAQVNVTRTIELKVTSDPQPVAGGGTANTAFLAAGNANASRVEATFWIETIVHPGRTLERHQLQYSQTVMLDFNGLSWPHVTVGTLQSRLPFEIPIQAIDPSIPVHLLREAAEHDAG